MIYSTNLKSAASRLKLKKYYLQLKFPFSVLDRPKYDIQRLKFSPLNITIAGLFCLYKRRPKGGARKNCGYRSIEVATVVCDATCRRFVKG